MKSEHLHIRCGREDNIRLEQMKIRHKKKVSKIVRRAIRYCYENPGEFDYFMAKLDTESE